MLSEFDKEPHGLLHDFWTLYNDSKSRQQMPGPSSRTLAGVLDSLRKTTPQIILEGYSIQELASKFIFYTSLPSHSVISYTSHDIF